MRNLYRILIAVNAVFLLITILGNFTTELNSTFQEGARANCISDAIYNDTTKDVFIQCMLKFGIFDANAIYWIFGQAILSISSITIAAITDRRSEGKNEPDKKPNNTPNTEPNDADKESLRLEYKIAYDMYNYYGKILWQIAPIFLTASLGGFALGIQQNLALDRFIPLNAVLSIFLIAFFFQARRLSWLAHLQMRRCIEIEKILHMKLATIQEESNKKEFEVGGKTIKPQRITGRYLNQGTPIAFLIMFWGYLILRTLGYFP